MSFIGWFVFLLQKPLSRAELDRLRDQLVAVEERESQTTFGLYFRRH